ncbi:hypothetical protein EC957_002557 [Mortierella hygrophila]|uniref:Uncharacterized protein n=1 Tax=Mortierella hygrophila TaxID=979708 RepID=A0A9P6F3C1_9FUNG|nr:hypothetical protein EC957_002557 [Mortierella hygrophila]
MDPISKNSHDTEHHLPELYMNILQCCPTLQIFIGYGSFLEPSKRSIIYKNSKLVRLKRTIIPRALGIPSHLPVVHMPHGYDLRHPHVRSPSIDELESLTVGSSHIHKTFTQDVQPSPLGHHYDFTMPWAFPKFDGQYKFEYEYHIADRDDPSCRPMDV